MAGRLIPLRPQIELVTVTALVILTRVADGVTTVLATPDLSRELNPLAAGGWPALIAAASVVVIISTFLHAQYLYRPVDNFPAEPSVDLRTFRKHYFDPHYNERLQAQPWRTAAYVFGYVMPRTLIIWSLLLILNNLLTAVPIRAYVEFKRNYPVWIAFYAALPAIGLILVERLQRLDHARYLNVHASGRPTGEQ